MISLVRHATQMSVAIQAMLLPCAAASQQAAQDTVPWGTVSNGLQLRVSTGVNTALLTQTQSLLYLTVTMRNVSDRPVTVNFDQSTYDFEYEIDGTWYAFEYMPPIRRPIDAVRADLPTLAVTPQTIAPGSFKGTVATVPLAGRSRTLQLFAVTAGGLGARFEPRPGAHVIRVRPGRALVDSARPAPVSNAVTVTFQIPAQLDTRSQTLTFATPPNTPLRVFQFVGGPPKGQEFIRQVLARPQYPGQEHQLINAAAIEVVEPLPLYDLKLVRRAGAPIASAPTRTSAYYYMLRTGEVSGFFRVDSTSIGPVLAYRWWDRISADSVFHGLTQLAQMDPVRGGSYEPRLAQLVAVRGAIPVVVLWLRATSGAPDLFYWPRDPGYRGATKLESGKAYSTDEFMAVAAALPAPRFNEAWGIALASACARAAWPAGRDPLIYERAVAELGLMQVSEPAFQGERLGWYVDIPERGLGIPGHSGSSYFVDETTGACHGIPRM